MHQPMPQGAANTRHAATERLRDDPDGIARAASLLRAGRLVAFGTETVYGLGADATDPRAVASIYAAKGRPSSNPLIAHFPDAGAAFASVRGNAMAQRLADAFWPGPLTLVLPRRPDGAVCALAAAGLDTLAVRVPGSATALALLSAAGRPIAAPSANRSGQVSPSTAAHVLDGLDGSIHAVLDSGPCRVGLESTILSLAGPSPRLLRPGGVTLEAIEALVGPCEQAGDAAIGATPSAPGQFASHYAPVLPVRLDAIGVDGNEALLSFGTPLAGAGLVWQLSDSADLAEAAASLFAGLRALDRDGARLGLQAIAVMPIPPGGLGRAIRDRLRRAASPRPGTPGTDMPGSDGPRPGMSASVMPRPATRRPARQGSASPGFDAPGAETAS